jgi:hypothetical protein
MTHHLTGDDRWRGLPRSRENRPSAGGYRFGRVRGSHGRGRAALSRVGGYLKTMIEAIADSKLRRMQRELELRGIYHDPALDSWMRKSQPTEHER